MSDYQLIVIGAGPGGYVTAIRAAQLGRKVAIVEKDKIGGTCLNRGCIPTKALLHSANTYAGRNQFETLGLSYADIRYDMGKIHARKAQVVETLISGVSGLLKANKIDVLSGAAQITAPGKVVVDGKEYTCEDIVIATGSYPARPPIPGLDLPGVVTSNEVLEGEPVDYKSLIIIGGGVIGVELASFYAALGCKVTIVEALDRLLSTLDKEFGQSIAMLLKKRGVQVFCSSMVSSIEQTPDGLVCNFTRKEQQEQVTAEGIVYPSGVLYLLGLKGHEDSKGFRGQGAQGVNLAKAQGQRRVQPFPLLPVQDAHLTQVLPGNGLKGFGIAIQFFLRIRQMYQRHHGEHQSLIPCGEIVQHLTGFLALLLQIVGDYGGIIVVLILSPLPIGHVSFYP